MFFRNWKYFSTEKLDLGYNTLIRYLLDIACGLQLRWDIVNVTICQPRQEYHQQAYYQRGPQRQTYQGAARRDRKLARADFTEYGVWTYYIYCPHLH